MDLVVFGIAFSIMVYSLIVLINRRIDFNWNGQTSRKKPFILILLFLAGFATCLALSYIWFNTYIRG